MSETKYSNPPGWERKCAASMGGLIVAVLVVIGMIAFATGNLKGWW